MGHQHHSAADVESSLASVEIDSQATSYGQVIEYIQGWFHPVATWSTSAHKRFHRPPILGFIHAHAQCEDTIPLPTAEAEQLQVSLEALITRSTSPDSRAEQCSPSRLLFRRQASPLQRLPCRLWSIAHRAPLPFCRHAARSPWRSREREQGRRLLEQS